MRAPLEDTVPSLFRCNFNQTVQDIEVAVKEYLTCSVTSCTELISRNRIRKTNFHNFLRFPSYGFRFRGAALIWTSKWNGIL